MLLNLLLNYSSEKMINRFKRKELLILKALGRYKFLTYSQMSKLGIDNHRSNLSTLVKGLRESRKPLVGKIPHRIGSEVKHYLTKKGKEILVESFDYSEEQIQFPKGKIITDTQDQKHRTTIINFHIDLDFACQENGIELVFCDRYFDTVGNNRIDRNLKSKTAILYTKSKSVKADMIFLLQTLSQPELFLLELENGKGTKKAAEKCIRHGQAILLGSANEKYKFNRGYRTLWVFEYESIMQATLERLVDIPLLKNLTEYFLFKSLEQMETGFFDNWLNLAREQRKMFY